MMSENFFDASYRLIRRSIDRLIRLNNRLINRLIFPLFILLLHSVTFGPARAEAAIAVRDDAGNQVSLQRPAQRIVSLAPHATELIFAAGGGDRIVGTVRYSDYPPAARDITRIGDYFQIDLERVIALKPDLLLVWSSGNTAQQLEHLRKLGIPLFYSDPRKLEDIPQTIARLGQLMGTGKVAQQTADLQRRQLASLAARYGRRPVVRVFYQIWDRPLYTLNGQHIVSEAIRLCGGENIFASLATIAPTVTIESVLQKNPEAIISGAQADEKADEKANGITERNSKPAPGSATAEPGGAKGGLEIWSRYPTLLATRRGNLFTIDADLLSRSGPRLIAGTAAVCEKLELARSRRGSE